MDPARVAAAAAAMGADLTDVGGIERGNVARCRVGSGDATVIVKAASDDPPGDGFLNEWAGATFLTSLPGGPPGTPAFLGGDLPAGVIVLEDLGDGPSLAQLLLGSDRGAAERGLAGWVDALARVHTATVGLGHAYRAHRAEVGPGGDGGQVEDHLERAAESIASNVDVPLPTGLVAAVSAKLRAEDFLVYRVNDVCPDNNRALPDGSVRLFDMEWGNASHALLDVAYVQATMPTCWCVRRLPDELQARLVERYRSTIADAIPAATTVRFAAELAAARVALALNGLGGVLKHATGPDADRGRHWDIYDFTMLSPRQSALLRIEQLTAAAQVQPWLADLGQWAAKADATLRARWGLVPAVPLYPALGGPPPSIGAVHPEDQ